ncbi:redox-sensitive transcriptional activator SoxR [Octadecabacter sp. 1_MG-2023]|uniref:redox-sensitive transcriptional activator SoxR n=1 Tax=unclassified Octadecabacter TaxID=196158 RepID=UPI001C07F8F2|nr:MULTISPECIES: redox-sensitive transcriptional activator SoxR [unclassified Octadecabacter]MBU2993412.1 redox-sensitive transcriptional activator SoxR [Octadecabacter sp. B2R22]MDO6733132.1 redox-sensitive transcriptional activator SoxR [Octadecabacter sp. 1_MG-2023]
MSGLTIGDLSARTGLAVSAIRFYETHGIVHPVRNAGGHRRYGAHDLRRLSFAMIAQKLGISLADIANQMTNLPRHKAPSKSDWARVSTDMRTDLNDRIAQLELLRDRLDGCIGCGCLSLDSCALYNPDDSRANEGTGPRALLP